MVNHWVFLYRLGLGLIGLMLVMLSVKIFVPKLKEVRDLQTKKVELKEETQEIDGHIENFKENQRKFNSDPDFVVRTAHEIGMVKTNEIVVKFTDGKTAHSGGE